MGTKMGPIYANLFVGYIENQFFNQYNGSKPELYRRYIDDCFGATSSTKISELRFENFLPSNGKRRVRTVSFHSTRITSFALIEMEDVESLLLVQLELHDDFDGDISDIV